MADVKRLNYYNHQLLIDKDFRDEQEYHIEMRRRHNRFMHGWGIADGLFVDRRGDREIVVMPGMAIDANGREMILLEEKTLPVPPLERAGHVYAVVNYREEGTNHHTSTGVSGFTRTVENPLLSFVPHRPPSDGTVIALARIYLDDGGRITEIDLSVRHEAMIRLMPGVIRTEFIANDAVTIPKLAPNLRRQHGWVRMSFKPHSLHEKPSFRMGPTEARAEKTGSWGTMGVPAPPGADRISGFRIAGEWNDGEIVIDLFRSGWDPKNQQHERESILRETLVGSSSYRAREGVDRQINPFERAWDLDVSLDRGHHALSVLVHATKEASISLIAIRFEYDMRDYERRQLRLR